MAGKILRGGLLAALLFGCENNETFWEPPRDVPLEDIYSGLTVQIYRGDRECMQTYRIKGDENPIICGSEEDFKYFARKGEHAIFIK